MCSSFDSTVNWSCGPMDKASVYGTGDSRFESWQDHFFATNEASPERRLRSSIRSMDGGYKKITLQVVLVLLRLSMVMISTSRRSARSSSAWTWGS